MEKYSKRILLNTAPTERELKALIERIQREIPEAERYNTADKKREVARKKEFLLFCEQVYKEEFNKE